MQESIGAVDFLAALERLQVVVADVAMRCLTGPVKQLVAFRFFIT